MFEKLAREKEMKMKEEEEARQKKLLQDNLEEKTKLELERRERERLSKLEEEHLRNLALMVEEKQTSLSRVQSEFEIAEKMKQEVEESIRLAEKEGRKKLMKEEEERILHSLRAAIESHLGLKKPGGERTFLNALPLSHHEKSELGKKYLRPPAPKAWTEDPDMWLDTNNIADVMNQYEEARTKNGVKEFEFMGPFPIDFAAPDPYKKGAAGEKKCLMNEICEIRVQQALENGTKSIGIVYNLDPHYKSGSHWVANYIDLAGHTCYYFDSYGMKPPPQVETFMKWLAVQDPTMKLQSNARRLQYSNTECGMYCIYMIIRMLEGDQFLQITRRKPKDADMLDLRDWIFST
jgi:hypothetical protein